MAKIRDIKFIDQHMEKIVLGVCALILVYGVFQWVLSAPLRTEVPKVNGRVVPVAEIDRKLLDRVNQLEQREPPGDPDEKVHDFLGAIGILRKLTDIAAIDNWGDPRPIKIPSKRVKPPEGIRLARIRDILETFSPEFAEIKGARELIDQGDGVDKLAFRGKAEFPLGALLKAWNKECRGSAMDEVHATVLNMEIEKREVLSEGAFGPVTQVSRVQIEEEPIPDVVIPEYDGKNAVAVRKAIYDFSEKTQSRILRPPYWRIWSQEDGKWTTPWIKKAEVPAKKPAPGAPPVAVGAAPAPVAIDDIELWFHDTDVIVQRKYSYRMRIVFASPLYTYDDVVYKGTPKDALVKSISSGWSQWVQTNAIPRTTQYFVTSAQGIAGMGQKMYCTIFTRCLGQVVADKLFHVLPGRIIGGFKDKKIKNPANGKIVLKNVDFSTSAIVVHVDFSRKVPSRVGFREIRELLCLEGGKLVSHIRVKDMPPDDERRKNFDKLQALVDAK